MKIRVFEHARWEPGRLAKVALVATGRLQLDLYCVGLCQSQKPHTHDTRMAETTCALTPVARPGDGASDS